MDIITIIVQSALSIGALLLGFSIPYFIFLHRSVQKAVKTMYDIAQYVTEYRDKLSKTEQTEFQTLRDFNYWFKFWRLYIQPIFLVLVSIPILTNVYPDKFDIDTSWKLFLGFILLSIIIGYIRTIIKINKINDYHERVC